MFSLDEVVVKDNTQELGDLSSLEGPIALHPEIFISYSLNLHKEIIILHDFISIT